MSQTDSRTDVADYLKRWHLEPDGGAFSTPSSVLAPVRAQGIPAMLKIALVEEEAAGNRLMTWWNGRGAASVLEHDDNAVLLERALGTRSLVEMARDGDDETATRILCAAAGRLHAITPDAAGPLPAGIRDLDDWFTELFQHADAVRADAVSADRSGGFHARAADIAAELLADQREVVVLHGDLHHGNVLDFTGRAGASDSGGWLAIDPKCIVGDRAFDFTNILCNPDAEVATRPDRLARQIDVITDAAGLDRERLVRWVVAWCGLSSAWLERAGLLAGHTLAVGLEAEKLLADVRRG
ncbi:aminoglycoside phosphotransferase family protein [Glaciibacter superstes]|uniref:aminoglycoside phosphotransferase family protein n=1 Tax=Glaciibacter superstes TaxID=501023 RepID=UPI0003B677CD|nr:aminoglycoside phosphotransferase family protein [Glaciibacter superstes]